jgi:tRNA (cmo5U34)-methyltransferase
LTLIQDSYLKVPLGQDVYDYALSVMSLHHLLPEAKRRLYARIRRALRPGGRYIEGDYVVSQAEAVRLLAKARATLAAVEGNAYGDYHVDVPFTLADQRTLLLEAGFVDFEMIWQQGEAAVYLASGPE